MLLCLLDFVIILTMKSEAGNLKRAKELNFRCEFCQKIFTWNFKADNMMDWQIELKKNIVCSLCGKQRNSVGDKLAIDRVVG